MNAIYNENDGFAAEWLDNLVGGGHIAAGRVDRRSIVELTPDDVSGPGQRHFFAGIGGWSRALRLAGLADDADIWTGSCPCQPFSSAGKRRGKSDARHLWPAWFALIQECRPAIVLGEQVASKDGIDWLDTVYADLERCGYTVGAADLCAAGIGAPHIRQRLFFVAYAGQRGREVIRASRVHEQGPQWHDASGCRTDGVLADAAGEPSGLRVHGGSQGTKELRRTPTRPSSPIRVGDTGSHGARQLARELSSDEVEHDLRTTNRDLSSVPAGATSGPWASALWVPCRDGVSRPIEPGTFPLAYGVSGRVAVVRPGQSGKEETHWYNRRGALRGFGNAIVPEVAATFIRAAAEAIEENEA